MIDHPFLPEPDGPPPRVTIRRGLAVEDVPVDSVDAYRAEIDDLQAAILDGTPPRVDLAFSRGSIAALVALDRAARRSATTTAIEPDVAPGEPMTELGGSVEGEAREGSREALRAGRRRAGDRARRRWRRCDAPDGAVGRLRPDDEPGLVRGTTLGRGAPGAIRPGAPNPPVHARNLFHLSVAMWDAWAAYDPVASGRCSPRSTPRPISPPPATEAISFAAYRILSPARSPGRSARASPRHASSAMAGLGSRRRDRTTGDTPAAVGNRIAAVILGDRPRATARTSRSTTTRPTYAPSTRRWS